ncbi:TetR/AcrR family transcriptional regulator C-terminal ligand-binding domain-containing protein [Kitasatospora sp. NBC_00315]|uniref:TetR/AcrR family transcriptional regulator n=1 Tax=Kitasatospora sp. NBC_00315 TaxID=2975963 RepID=UPI0032549E6B
MDGPDDARGDGARSARTQEPAGARPGTLRPGGRTARTRAAVLAAARAELIATGFANMTVEKVAARAGVAKTTVYARWRDVSGLVVDLLSELTVRTVPLPDTGSLAGDLRRVAADLLALARTPAERAVFEAVLATAIQDEQARRALTEFYAFRLATTGQLVERAIARGEVPADTDPKEVVRTLAAPFYYRLFVSGEPMTEADADRAAAVAAHAAAAGLLPGGCQEAGSAPDPDPGTDPDPDPGTDPDSDPGAGAGHRQDG